MLGEGGLAVFGGSATVGTGMGARSDLSGFFVNIG
jgi:hypothetical protein